MLANRWPAERKKALTRHMSARGRFSSHPFLPYVLRPNYNDDNNKFMHNGYGLRGKSFDIKKPPGVFRIVCLGASTTYCIYAWERQTYPDRLEQLIEKNGLGPVEVLNAGVPGWTSMETLINFQLRLLNLDPDMIIVYHGHNDIFPQGYNNFSIDYSHYRDPDYSFRYTNFIYKPIFRFSNSLLLISYLASTRLGINLFGWSYTDENPIYGVIQFENRPTEDKLIGNFAKEQYNWSYRNNLETLIQICQARKIKVVLCTLAFRKDLFYSGIIPESTAMLPYIKTQLMENNETVRTLACEYDVPLVDCAAEPALQDYLVDQCHFNVQGQRARAQMIYEHIEPHLN
jgi:lysophospholipase L1-like esterase